MTLQNAIRVAAQKHGETADKGGQPFIGHPLRVMAKVAASYPQIPEYVLEAAALHDVLEDTGTDRLELIAEDISEEAVNLVEVLTRHDNEGYFDYIDRVKRGSKLSPVYNEGYFDYIDRSKLSPVYDEIKIEEGSLYAPLIKLADLSDNLNPARRVPGLKLPERYERAVAMLKA